MLDTESQLFAEKKVLKHLFQDYFKIFFSIKSNLAFNFPYFFTFTLAKCIYLLNLNFQDKF